MSNKGRCVAALRAIVLICSIFAGAPVLAYETALDAPGAPEDLRDRLARASAVMSAQTRGLNTVQELLAASLSDYRTLVQVLYDEGYFSSVVHIRLDGREAASIEPLTPPSRVAKIVITVDPGRPFRFGRAAIAPLAPGTEIPDDFASGRPAGTGRIQEAAVAGVNGWRAAGHAKAGVGRQRIVARHPAAELDADIELRPGPLLRFGRMTVTGESAVRETSIRRIAGFPTGEVYDPDKLQRAGTRLRRTGTFSSVAIREAEQPNADGTLDFTTEIQDLPPRRLSVGAELSSRTGLELSFRWTHRNLFHGAERLQFESRVRNIGGTENIDGTFSLRLDRPDRLGPDDSIFYIAELERLNRTNYDLSRARLGIGVKRFFSPELFGEISLNAAYSSADDAFGTSRKFRYAVVPARLEWDRRDNKVNATEGFYLNTRVSPFVGLSGTESGGQITLDARGYWSPLASDRIVLAGRLQLGSVVGAPLSTVSPDLLFFSGGAGTVRGQPYESLGVPVGAAIAGGRSFLGLSTELRGHITEKISLVGFYDFGAVDSGSLIDSGSPRHAGAGIGVRYDLGGFGPVRLDLAWPVSGSTGDGLQFYIGIGQAF
ncbi:MAG: autotransporter assembly complex protein TamA [Jhaorihella sp.]